MDLNSAAQYKAFIAEKQLALVRAIIIVFSTVAFLLSDNPAIKTELAYWLLVPIWVYGLFVLLFKPYKKYPVFLAAWFTYSSDCIFASLWIYATGGVYSPFHVLFYTSIIAVAFRFNLRTTLFTASLYVLAYCALIYFMGQFAGNEARILVRTGYVFIIGYMTNLITQETLNQTEQKLVMEKLANEARAQQQLLQQNQDSLASLNNQLNLRNLIYSHAEENADVGSYAWNLSGNKLDYSDNLFRILDHEPGDFVPSVEKYLSFIHPDDREEMRKAGEDTLQKRIVRPTIHRIVTAKGRHKHLKATGKIATIGADEYMIGTLQDITEDLTLNEELSVKNKELERSNGELASFNYVASHDLQEPVRKINTFSRMILDKDKNSLSPLAIDYLGRISSSASRMQSLIEAFLNYSRLDSTALVFDRVDLNEVINEIRQELADIAEEKKAIFKVSQLPVINGVQLQLHQLFINLLSNALKYSKNGEQPVITINSTLTKGQDKAGLPDERKNYWKISVADNGIGFDPQYAIKIFEVFQRLHSKDQYAGTGIGLSICKKIVETHHGLIMAEGEIDKGSEFTVYLPA